VGAFEKNAHCNAKCITGLVLALGRGRGLCLSPEKYSKYTKTENNPTADHELLPKEQNTTDLGCQAHSPVPGLT